MPEKRKDEAQPGETRSRSGNRPGDYASSLTNPVTRVRKDSGPHATHLSQEGAPTPIATEVGEVTLEKDPKRRTEYASSLEGNVNNTRVRSDSGPHATHLSPEDRSGVIHNPSKPLPATRERITHDKPKKMESVTDDQMVIPPTRARR